MQKMKNPEKYIRNNILALAPYSTARDECKADDISVWLDANESPYPNGCNRYPDPHQHLLKKRIAEIFSMDAKHIFVGGAGSDEAIDITFRVFCEPRVDNAIAIAPSYGVYKVSAAINDVEIREVLLNEDFSLPADRILEAADSHTKLIWLCSPNNPTGNAFRHDDILKIVKGFDGIVVVDEAYADFSEKESMMSHIAENPNLIVLRTFSKAWGMAGLRCGMAFGDERIIKYYDRVKYPYNMSVIVQRELLNRLVSVPDEQIAEIVRWRGKVADGLKEMESVVEVYPSDANFLLVKVKDAYGMYDFLIKYGAIVRNRSSMPLCSNTLRITIGTTKECRRVLELVKCYDSGVEPEKESGSRAGEYKRSTKETDIEVKVNLDGGGESSIDTGLKFFDHMLWQIPHHAGISLSVKCTGDLEVDEHHTMEDVAIALGEAITRALGDKRGIGRYGFMLPMDESRALVLMDLGGRIDFKWNVPFTREYVGDTPTEMYSHFFQSLCSAMRCNLQIEASGENNHHLIEGVFKAFARALRQAVHRNPDDHQLPSSKGIL